MVRRTHTNNYMLIFHLNPTMPVRKTQHKPPSKFNLFIFFLNIAKFGEDTISFGTRLPN